MPTTVKKNRSMTNRAETDAIVVSAGAYRARVIPDLVPAAYLEDRIIVTSIELLVGEMWVTQENCTCTYGAFDPREDKTLAPALVSLPNPCLSGCTIRGVAETQGGESIVMGVRVDVYTDAEIDQLELSMDHEQL